MRACIQLAFRIDIGRPLGIKRPHLVQSRLQALSAWIEVLFKCGTGTFQLGLEEHRSA